MAQALKAKPDSHSGVRFGDSEALDRQAAGFIQAPHTPVRRISTVGELAVRAGLDREPVVRKWQKLIDTALSTHAPADEYQRWDLRRSVPFLVLLSTLLWIAIGIGAAKLL